MKRRGNRRYYQHHEVLLIRRIRELLYEQGFTISGARNRLVEGHHSRSGSLPADAEERGDPDSGRTGDHADAADAAGLPDSADGATEPASGAMSPMQLRQELISIRGLLAL